jgi:hypothetical protein
MRRWFQLFVLAVVGGTTCLASEEVFSRGIAGDYRRQAIGLYEEVISLRADHTFVFTFRFDIGADEQIGTWEIRDSVLLLTPKKKGQIIKSWPARFRIIPLDGDLALSAIDGFEASEPEESAVRVFRPLKKRANQSLQPTAPSGRG